MKKLILSLAAITICSFAANSQRLMDKLDPTSSGALFRSDVLNKKDLAKIEGYSLLDTEFRLADITGINQQVLARYNAFTDMVEVQNEKKEVFSLMKKEPFTTISIAPFLDKIKLAKYTTKEGVVEGYLVELFTKNNIILYRKEKIILQKGKEAVNSYSPATPAKYVKAADEYFVSVRNETAVTMPKNKKEMLLLFPEKADEITNYLKKNDFSLKDETSVLNMVRFLAGS